jgi:hypothetical protein
VAVICIAKTAASILDRLVETIATFADGRLVQSPDFSKPLSGQEAKNDQSKA